MTVPNEVGIVVEIVSIIVTFYIVLKSIPLVKNGNRPMTAMLFSFAITSLMLSLAYWLAYSIIRPDSRMPLAANEIGEMAFFLLLASVLDSIFKDSSIPAKKEITGTVFFTIASVALWIAWSGEWVQDLIFGFAFGYFLNICVRSIKQTDAFNQKDWIILSVCCMMIILGQTSVFHVPEMYKQTVDTLCYILMFATLAWLFIKCIKIMKENKSAEEIIAMTFTVCAFSYSTLYMSAGWYYVAVVITCMITLPLMFYAVRKTINE